jgi:ketosteroid isomerase-like protein
MTRIRFAVLLCALSVPALLSAQQADEATVRQVASAFGKALASGDSSTVIRLLHPDVAIFEGGRWENLDQYRSGHLRADMAYLQAVKQETVRDVVTLAGDLAVVLRESSTTGTYRDRAVDSIGIETMVLQRTPDGWKIKHIHWSSRPRTRQPG